MGLVFGTHTHHFKLEVGFLRVGEEQYFWGWWVGAYSLSGGIWSLLLKSISVITSIMQCTKRKIMSC
jgi:hypothetical protein